MYNKTVGYMNKNLKVIFITFLLAAALLIISRAASIMQEPSRIWVDGIELTSGMVLEVGGGMAEYEPEKKLLTLTNASITGGIFAESSLNIELRGKSAISGEANGIQVLGDLYVFGDGSLHVRGRTNGLFVLHCLSVSGRASLNAEGKRAFRVYRGIHISPLYTINEDGGKASFIPPYLVTLELGEGQTAYLEFKVGDKTERPVDPERSGYWFDNWYADSELTQPYDFGINRYDDVTIYAGWIKIVYVAFDSWGGTEVPLVEIAHGDCVPVPEAPTREGYIFEGWYADSKLTQEYDFTIPQTENLVLYAKWTKIAEAVYKGIDVARYQLEIDWNAVKSSGVDFAIIRAGYRGYGAEGSLNTDDNFYINIEGAIKAGLDVGVYFFSQATTVDEAIEEALYLLEIIKDYPLTLPVFMDFELASNASGELLGRLYDARLSGEENAEICLAFCRVIERAGYTAMVYAGKDMLSDVLADRLKQEGYGVWLANWTVQTSYNGDYVFWQYSSTGVVEGIKVNTDLNIRYIDSPPKVENLRADAIGTKVRLRWDRVPGVYGYIIYRYDSASGGFMEYARTKGAAITEFLDSKAEAGSRYMVCAYILQNGIEYRGSLSDAAAVPER